MNSSTRTLSHRNTLSHHTCVNALAISPHGDYLLSGGEAVPPFLFILNLTSNQGTMRMSLYGTSTHRKNVKLSLPHLVALSPAWFGSLHLKTR